MRIIETHPGVPQPSTGILKREVLKSYTDVAASLEEAQRLGEERIAEALREHKDRFAKAEEAAYREGLALFADAVAQYQTEAERMQGQILDMMREALTTLLVDCDETTIVSGIIGPSIDKVIDGGHVIFEVCATQVEAMQDALETFFAQKGIELDFLIEASDRAGRGQCTVFNTSQVFDFGIPVIVERLIEGLQATPTKIPTTEVEED